MASAFSLDRFLSAPPLERSRAVAEGLPAKAVRDLVAHPAISIADVARIVGPRRTIDRRLRDNARLSPDESERLERFARTLDLAVRVFGDRKSAMDWLSTPKQAFSGAAALDLLKNELGGRLVEDHLQRALHGFFA